MEIKVFNGARTLHIDDKIVERYNYLYKGNRAAGTEDAEMLLMTEEIDEESKLDAKELEEKLKEAMEDEIAMAEDLADIENVKKIMAMAGAYAGRVKAGKEE